MSAAMTMKELGDLLNHIKSDHSFCMNKNGRHVKYVDPKIDTRDWMCFAITFRLFGEPVLFHTQNECAILSRRNKRKIDGTRIASQFKPAQILQKPIKRPPVEPYQ